MVSSVEEESINIYFGERDDTFTGFATPTDGLHVKVEHP
jgi:hypothetical protein